MAEAGASMKEIIDKLEELRREVGTLSVCLNPCSLPGQPPNFYIGPEDMEFGVGIHGEAGVLRTGVGNNYLKNPA
jgi:dihydroxyacetone kinase